MRPSDSPKTQTPRRRRAARASRTAVVAAAAGTLVAALAGCAAGSAVGDTTEGAPVSRTEPAVAEVREASHASRGSERVPVGDAEPEAAPEVVMPLTDGTYESTSAYGHRTDPVTGAQAKHEGTDMAAPVGTPIHAVAGGEVTHVGPGKDGRSDMLIIIEHELDGETFYSWYNHMYRDGLYVEVGQEVSAGDVIGGVGSNGKSTGPHLHLEIHTDDELTTTDPLTWLAERGAVDVSQV